MPISVIKTGNAVPTNTVAQSPVSVPLQSITDTRSLVGGATDLVTESESPSTSVTSSPSTVTASPYPYTSTQASASSSLSTANISAYCHNDDSKDPIPCQATSDTKTTGSPSSQPAATSNNIGYSPPGTSVYRSPAWRLSNPLSPIFRAVKRSRDGFRELLDILSDDMATESEAATNGSLNHEPTTQATIFGVSLIVFVILASLSSVVTDFIFRVGRVIRWIFNAAVSTMTRRNATKADSAGTLHTSKLNKNALRLNQRRLDIRNRQTQVDMTKVLGNVATPSKGPPLPSMPHPIDAGAMANSHRTFFGSSGFDIRGTHDLSDNQPLFGMAQVDSYGHPLSDQNQLIPEISIPMTSPLQPFKHRNIESRKEMDVPKSGDERRFSRIIRIGKQGVEMVDPTSIIKESEKERGEETDGLTSLI